MCHPHLYFLFLVVITQATNSTEAIRWPSLLVFFRCAPFKVCRDLSLHKGVRWEKPRKKLHERIFKGHLIHVEVHRIKLSLSFEPSSKRTPFFIWSPNWKTNWKIWKTLEDFQPMAWLENQSISLQPNFGIQDQKPNWQSNSRAPMPSKPNSSVAAKPVVNVGRPWAGSGRRYQGCAMWLFKGIDFLSHISRGNHRKRWSKMLFTTNKCYFLFLSEWVWINRTRSHIWNLWPRRALALDLSLISYIFSFLLREVKYTKYKWTISNFKVSSFFIEAAFMMCPYKTLPLPNATLN